MMHQYSIDTKERTNITAYLALMSVIVTFILQKLLGVLEVHYWWFPAPSAITIFWALHFLFSSRLWKCSVLRAVNLVKTPDISGTWQAKISTSHDDHEKKIDGELRIIQNWKTIEFALETGESSSRSHSAHLCFTHPQDVIIHYEYLNDPKTGTPETMNIHHGTASLRLSNNGKTLKGDYYAGRGRGTLGTMEFERKD